MEATIDILEIIAQISILVFGISIFLIIRTVRKHHTEFVESAVTNPVFPNLDLRFYPSVLKKHAELTKSKGMATLNLASLAVFVICIVSFFLLQ